MSVSQGEIDAVCRQLYSEVAAFPPIAAVLGADIGFEILMGQPFYEPPVLFIGYQPGDGALSPLEAREAGFEKDWVFKGRSQYSTESWLLATKLRGIFGPNNISLLDRSVGLNAIYIRARNVASYRKTVKLADRKMIQDFCREKNDFLIKTIKPKKIVVLGFGTMDVFGSSIPDVVGDNKKPVTKIGDVFGVNALAVRHLTGARFSANDYILVKDRIREFIGLR